MTNKGRLEEIEERLGAIKVEDGLSWCLIKGRESDDWGIGVIGYVMPIIAQMMWRQDARFAANAPADVAWLITQLTAAWKREDELAEILDSCQCVLLADDVLFGSSAETLKKLENALARYEAAKGER